MSGNKSRSAGVIVNMSDLTECYVDDDGGQSSPVLAVEAQEQGVTPQSLWVRVGPVFTENGTEGPVVWINYQEAHMNGPLSGPVLLTPEAWYELVEAVNTRLENFDAEAYRPKPRKKMKVEDYFREEERSD